MKTAHILCSLAMAASVAPAAVSYEPVTAGATAGARKLYNFLATNYGVRTISGVMTGDAGTGTDVKKQVDVDTLFQRSGKYPALVGFDFLFATGTKASDAWYKSYTEATLAQAKDLWAKGGIPAFTWHWKDPSDSIDAFYTKSGNDKEYTTFDYTKGFAAGTTTWDTASATYKQLVSDIDEIAALFLSLQKDSVAAVFRPLHEASGGWFWWGTKGGAAFQALYNLVHDRMVETDGVKNLVWVWNPNVAADMTWNPGAAKYDVLSLDIYGAYDYTKKFVAGYKELTTNYGASNKILAVSENGPIPDISTMKAANTMWSWWMPWYQSWSGRFLDQTVDAVWKANMADPCVVTLDEMPGWADYALSEAPVAACQVGYALGDLDSARPPAVVKVPGDTASNRWLRVQFSTPAEDTAKGNIIIASGTIADLSKATTMTLKVVNGNTQAGIWFTVAFLGNAATGWGWAQPDGCWVNPGDSTLCTFDLATTTQDKVVLKGEAYETFMANLNKVYLEIFGDSWSGDLFFDDVKAGTTVINDFEKAATIKFEQAKNLEFAKIIGGSLTGIRTPYRLAAHRLELVGRQVRFDLPRTQAVSVALHDLQGQRVASLHRGTLPAGTHTLDLGAVKPGVYVVRVLGPHTDASRKVVVE